MLKIKVFFTPETSTRFYFQKKDTLNLKALMNHTWSDCFQEVRKKDFLSAGLRIEDQKLGFFYWLEYGNSSFVGLVIGEQNPWLYSQNGGPRQIFWEMFQLISSAALGREQVNLKISKNQLKDVKISKYQLNIQENIQELIKSVRQPILAQSQELVSQILDKPNQLRGGGAGKKIK